MQKRLEGLMRDTWWLWCAFALIGLVMIFVISKVFLVTIPVLIVAFVYYATMRYDDDGNHKGEGPGE